MAVTVEFSTIHYNFRLLKKQNKTKQKQKQNKNKKKKQTKKKKNLYACIL